ncbi:hypothetical protein MKEN_00713100 [Mycena kentingensis (nom. inval.)]|nr:hypothetical protein MKEN_00713100 [Mycena kentingensis (nom. inval.)]
MSKDMPLPPLPWKATTTSRLSAVKSYVSQRDFKNMPQLQRGVNEDGSRQSWKDWAGQKLSSGLRGTGAGQGNRERIALFPGWAARRYRAEEPDAFDVELFVSGFASSHRAPELASRSQRAFIRLAKGFAALPKLDGSGAISQSTENLLSSVKLPPKPSEITEELEVEALERQFQKLNRQGSTDDFESPLPSNDDDAPSPLSRAGPSAASFGGDLQRMHNNLETRIQPFWSSVLASRTIRLHLFASPLKGPQDSRPTHNAREERDALEHGPIAQREVVTGVDGSFQARFRISWEEMCQHPGALHIAFGDPDTEHELLVTATLAPATATAALQSILSQPETKTLHITLTNCPIRVISDIDDTVKLSGVLTGARSVFHNVFVKEYHDIVIPGMGEWYTGMWKRGVRFHYVSNGPFELLPIIADFFQVSQLPPGSIKLRSYAGRSLFSGLLSAPAVRKRAGLVDILEAFPESRFFLIGDSGEQDLELYAELASEHPEQILAVFIRDVDADSLEPVEDPTGWKAMGFQMNFDALPTATPTSTSPAYSLPPSPPESWDAQTEYFTSPVRTQEPQRVMGMSLPITPAPATAPNPIPPPTKVVPQAVPRSAPAPTNSATSTPRNSMYAASIASTSTTASQQMERRRYDLQLRIWRARTMLPLQIPLRLFRDPKECVEAGKILSEQKL